MTRGGCKQFYQERAGQGSAELLFDSHASRGRDKTSSDKDKGKDGAKAADAAPSPLKVRTSPVHSHRLVVETVVV